MRQTKTFFIIICLTSPFLAIYPESEYIKTGDNWRKKAFTWIYDHHHWRPKEGEPISGEGATLQSTETLRNLLPAILKTLNVKTILDAGCGDFTWMQTLKLGIEKYIGVDIVEKLIETNKIKYETGTRLFLCRDIVKDALPKVDLIICRDCLAHLSNEDIMDALKNFKKSGSQYLLASTFPKIKINRKMNTGDFRGINLNAYPYNLSKPIMFFEELSAEKNMIICGKCIAVWKLQKLNI